MKITILGSGGAVTTPRTSCSCAMCEEARIKGAPYSRTGPSVYVHGPELLIDTPEEIKAQLNREGIRYVKNCTYSHWHPDHVLGRRVWEMNLDFVNWPPRNLAASKIFLAEQVAKDFRERLGSYENFEYFAKLGAVEIVELSDGESFESDGYSVLPFRLSERYVYGFIIEGHGKRALVIMDELFGWEPDPSIGSFDLVVMPTGICEFHPISGVRQVTENHPVFQSEATYQQTLAVCRKLKATRIVLSHVEEPDNLSFGVGEELDRAFAAQGLPITLAYDGLSVEI